MCKFRSALLAVVLSLGASSALAATVSTIGVAAQTVTVTSATAHGLAVNQGFCLTSTPACAVVATVTNATTFTFTQPSNVSVAACAASCGTVTVAPKIIILDMQQPNQATQTVHYLLWLTTSLPLPRAGGSSAWTAAAASAGASAAQNNAIAAGSFIEVNQSASFPSSLTNAQMQVFLQNDYTTRQAALAANTQPAAYYGSVWDGSAWTVQ